VSSRVRGTRLRADFGFWILDGEILTRANLAPGRSVHMKGAKGVIRGKTWRWEKWISWAGVGGEGGDGSACVAGEADSFEIGHF